ncbi:MAG: hypothetical protein IT442_01650 [Phycisphaeraceae bacterium]|nr:hypothetical protein [Phycisphaeraceae bacterium]
MIVVEAIAWIGAADAWGDRIGLGKARLTWFRIFLARGRRGRTLRRSFPHACRA